MARSIWTLRSSSASARRENPTATPRTKPIDPPMAKPAAARSRLIPISGISWPLSISFIAVATTLVGAGRICGDSPPRRAHNSQITNNAKGASQGTRTDPERRSGALRAGMPAAGICFSLAATIAKDGSSVIPITPL
jgi:hypothetical protein